MASKSAEPTNPESFYTSSSQVFPSIGQKLYLKDEIADFHFIFYPNDGHRIRIPSHKLLLTKGSDVFRTMFNGSWNEINEVVIVESIDAFKEFLQYFYLTEVKVTMENVAEVMYLGNKYNVDECLEVCSKFLTKSINESNVCFGYNLALTYDQKSLKSFCETIIAVKTKKILSSDDFLQCDFETLTHIVKLEGLSCKESELFQACLRCIKAANEGSDATEEVKREKIRSLFKDFRFGSMLLSEWIDLSAPNPDLFSYDEYREVVSMITSLEFQPEHFSGIRQKRIETKPYNEANRIFCVRLVSLFCSEYPYYIKPVESTIFSTNQTVLLKAFDCLRIYKFSERQYTKGKANRGVTYSINKLPDLKYSNAAVVLYSGKFDLESETNSCVTFDEPILIESDQKYEIRLEQSQTDNYCTGALLKQKIEVQPDFTVQTYDDPVVHDDRVVRGLIRDFEFIRI